MGILDFDLVSAFAEIKPNKVPKKLLPHWVATTQGQFHSKDTPEVKMSWVCMKLGEDVMGLQTVIMVLLWTWLWAWNSRLSTGHMRENKLLFYVSSHC